MVKRFDITKGDGTTKGGKVCAGDPLDIIGDREQAYETAPVWCPACKTMGRIGCIGTGHLIGPNGRKGALSEDLCICKCEPSPRLIASQQDSFVEV